MLNLAKNLIKRSRPPSSNKRGSGRRHSGSKRTAVKPSSVLIWTSGKIVTTILPALICGIGLGIGLGYWLDPRDQNRAAKSNLKTMELVRAGAVRPTQPPTVPDHVNRNVPAQPRKAPAPFEERPQSNPSEVVSPSVAGTLKTVATATRQQWLANAVAVTVGDDRPTIALVIDDVGIDLKRSRRAVALEAPLTIAIMTYANDVAALAKTARQNGHELIVHVPMEPVDFGSDTGPNALLTSLDDDELMQRLRWALSRFDGYVGISNHMGSRFTAWKPGMQLVLTELHKRGLLYLDSRTTAESASTPLARLLGLPYATRDVFLDNDPTPDAVRRQLEKLEKIARRRGHAIGIGHPHDATIEVLESWLEEVKDRGFVLVPISAIVRLAKS